MKDLLRERAKLLEEFGTLSSLLHGSWVERYSTCSRETCDCHKGKRHGPRHYLVINENGRQRQKYIPNRLVGDAKEGIAQYTRVKEIVRRITTINLILMKEANYGS